MTVVTTSRVLPAVLVCRPGETDSCASSALSIGRSGNRSARSDDVEHLRPHAGGGTKICVSRGGSHDVEMPAPRTAMSSPSR